MKFDELNKVTKTALSLDPNMSMAEFGARTGKDFPVVLKGFPRGAADAVIEGVRKKDIFCAAPESAK